MDVGDPSNFARIIDLYKNSYEKISEMIKGYYFRDEEIKEIVKKVYRESNYMCDPHGACGIESLNEYLSADQIGVFLETAHPAKFAETMEDIIGKGKIELPEKLKEFMKGKKRSIFLSKEFEPFKQFLLENVV